MSISLQFIVHFHKFLTGFSHGIKEQGVLKVYPVCPSPSTRFKVLRLHIRF